MRDRFVNRTIRVVRNAFASDVILQSLYIVQLLLATCSQKTVASEKCSREQTQTTNHNVETGPSCANKGLL